MTAITRDGRRFDGATAELVVRGMQAGGVDAGRTLPEYVRASVERARDYEGAVLPDIRDGTDEEVAEAFLAAMNAAGLLMLVLDGGGS